MGDLGERAVIFAWVLPGALLRPRRCIPRVDAAELASTRNIEFASSSNIRPSDTSLQFQYEAAGWFDDKRNTHGVDRLSSRKSVALFPCCYAVRISRESFVHVDQLGIRASHL